MTAPRRGRIHAEWPRDPQIITFVCVLLVVDAAKRAQRGSDRRGGSVSIVFGPPHPSSRPRLSKRPDNLGPKGWPGSRQRGGVSGRRAGGRGVWRLVEYGYARVSTLEQDAQLQLDALTAAGVPAGNIHVDRASGTRDDRPALLEVLAKVGEGDRLTVWRAGPARPGPPPLGGDPRGTPGPKGGVPAVLGPPQHPPP